MTQEQQDEAEYYQWQLETSWMAEKQPAIGCANGCETKDKLRKGLCARCYSRHRYHVKKYDTKFMEKRRVNQRNKYRNRVGIPLDSPLLNAPSGAGTLNSYGYRVLTIKNHPNSMKNGRMLEHIYVMSQHLGRALKKHENVHHLNGISDDNRIENLELWTRSQPPGGRLVDKIKWAIEFLTEYNYEVKDAR